MKLKLNLFRLSPLLLIPVMFYAGCKPGAVPVAPAASQYASVSVAVPSGYSKTISGPVSVLYCVFNSSSSPITQGAQSVTASGESYPIYLTVDKTKASLVSFQFNDYSGNVLAVGAQSISSSSPAQIPVTLGPINSCYTVTMTSTNDYFNFENDSLTSTSTNADIQWTAAGNSLISLHGSGEDPQGNGNFLNFAPFTTYSQTLFHPSVGDVDIVTISPSGFAWLQVTSVTSTSLTFIYRISNNANYLGYQQSTADENGTCGGGGNTSTITNTSTQSGTPTNTATITWTSTVTNTPTQTGTATNTVSATPTGTATNTATLTWTSTLTNTATLTPSATVTATYTNSNTATLTDTATPSSTATNSFTPTATATNTNSSTATNSPTSTNSFTATNTATNSFTASFTSTATFSSTATNSPTVTSSFTATNTATSSFTASLTPTATVSSTPTNSPTPYVTRVFITDSFNQPQAVAYFGGFVYVADSFNNKVDKINSSGTITNLVGTYSYPEGVAVDASGNVYVADQGDSNIIKVNSTNTTAVTLNSGSFNSPQAVAVDGSGNIYVADTSNSAIKEISGGVVTTLPGTFSSPKGVAVNNAGTTVYASDANNMIVQEIYGGSAVTLAGSSGNPGYTDATGTSAQFFSPEGIAVDSLGNVYVADLGNNVIRKITSGGVVSTLAGSTLGNSGSTNGPALNSLFSQPSGVAFDTSGDLYIADQSNNFIREYIP